ncbi:MAG: hypothetical protein Q8N95_12225 [Desulfobacterales bacterium]|nr:hypothetical protein [Desulfobacterales bacterium]
MEITTKDSAVESATQPTNQLVLWRQIMGFLLCVSLFSYFTGGIVGAILSLVLGGATFADAWVSGIYKKPGRKSFLNISPMAWGIAMVLVFIVVYPVYLLNRNKLRTIQAGNGLFIATIVLEAMLIVYFALILVAVRTGAVV